MTWNIKNVSFGLSVAILTAGVFGMGIQATHAYQGDVTVAGSNYSSDHHEAVQQAFQNRDYDVSKEAMGGSDHMTEMVTAASGPGLVRD